MKICGIDQSFSATAVVTFDLHSGEMLKIRVFKSKKTDDAPLDERVTRLSNKIIEYLEEEGVEYVSIESLSLMSHSASSLMLAGLFYVLLDKFRERFIQRSLVAPNQLKLFATGYGRSKKEELFDAIPEDDKERIIETGYKKTTGLHDISDAYHLGHHLLNKLKNPENLT